MLRYQTQTQVVMLIPNLGLGSMILTVTLTVTLTMTCTLTLKNENYIGVGILKVGSMWHCVCIWHSCSIFLWPQVPFYLYPLPSMQPPHPLPTKKKKCCRKIYLYLSTFKSLYLVPLLYLATSFSYEWCYLLFPRLSSCFVQTKSSLTPFPPVCCTFWSAIKVAHLNSPFSPYNPYSLVCFYQVILSLFGKLSWIYSPPNIAGNEGFKIAHCGPKGQYRGMTIQPAILRTKAHCLCDTPSGAACYSS